MNSLEPYIKKCKKIDKLGKNSKIVRIEHSLIEKDFIYFLDNWVITQDEHDMRYPFKPVPDYDYLRYIAKSVKENEIILVCKSRQIMITWLFSAYMLWSVLYNKGQLCTIISKRGSDADMILLRRIKLIYDYIPNCLKPEIKISKKYNAKMEVPKNSSSLWAFPQGSDVVRSYTFTKVFFDEMAFMNMAEQAYTALLPTIKGGGKLIGVSSVKRNSFFMNLIHEFIMHEFSPRSTIQISWKDIKRYSTYTSSFRKPMRGIISYLRDNMSVIFLNYRAKKDYTEQEIIEMKKGYSESKWKQEMEMDSTIESGQLVFEGFPSKKHIIKPFKIPSDWIKGRALDYGFIAPTAMLWFAIDPDKKNIYFYREYYECNLTISEHKENILYLSLEDIPDDRRNKVTNVNELYLFQIIDPQAKSISQSPTSSSEKKGDSLTSIMMQYLEEQIVEINGKKYDAGIFFTSGRRKAIDGLYRIRNLFEKNKIFIFENCQNFIREIKNYTDKTDNLLKNKKPNCADDHLIDCAIFAICEIPPLCFDDIEIIKKSEIQKHIDYVLSKQKAFYDNPLYKRRKLF